eukprot:TRINITY_DN7449_c0_g1_i1.p1 TRINITY_DN7449_c0_g1~~TRINITY_DN7449_c0_g1_i1.p1  ORF type:complete len:320 (+),score=37.99 TRINITY_DN7449_c0_g1_i1:150-1109(+)
MSHEHYMRCVRCPHAEARHVHNIHAEQDFTILTGWKARSTALYEQIIASSGATLAVTTFASPINMVKVRVQANTLPVAPMEAVRQLWRENGVRAFYSAWPISVAMSIPSGVVYILTYEQCRDYMAAHLLASHQLGYAPLLAGFTSRIVCSTIFAPLELLAIKVQCSSNPSIAKTIAKVYRNEGIAGFYRGLGLTLLRDAPFSALYWMFMTDFKTRIHQRHPNWAANHPFETTFAAAGSGCFLAGVLTQPMDILKTRMQTATTCISLRTVLRGLYANYGVLGFFQGLGLRTMQMVPASALFMACFEAGRRQLHRYFELHM